ncbi:MAG TPA: glycosyltransferase 87 family protein [Streptosporangiaceae bacterium]|nr:glycosyltransferase 87 family protein [Streptosporangiaceae bacterium]
MSALLRSGSARLAAGVRPTRGLLLIVGAVLFAITISGYCAFIVTHPADAWLSPVDLNVYRLGGEVVAHIRPHYKPALAAPLYDWPGFGLKFTYTPFAAIVFTVFVLVSWGVLPEVWLAVNIVALLATIWLTLGALGYRASLARLGGTLALAALLFWTEPVQRTMYLGQIELVLMVLIIWDLCQPERRKWQGIGLGIAAGIKLVPLVFIPFLLLTRRYRQAAVAAGTFAATVIIGFVVLPADSRAWWLDGLLFKSSRTGFTGWEGNQSLAGLITRLSGSIAAGQPIWMLAAAVVLIGGIACAVAIARAGHWLLGVLTCALTGLLVSPISWDHHWVWIVSGVTVLACYGIRSRGWVRWAWLSGAVLIAALFGAWPGALWGQPQDLGGFSEGLIWWPPNTNPGTFERLGDRPWYVEYHWHGFQLIVGNLYVLAGLAMLLTAAAVTVRVTAARRGRHETPEAATGRVPLLSGRRYR